MTTEQLTRTLQNRYFAIGIGNLPAVNTNRAKLLICYCAITVEDKSSSLRDNKHVFVYMKWLNSE